MRALHTDGKYLPQRRDTRHSDKARQLQRIWWLEFFSAWAWNG